MAELWLGRRTAPGQRAANQVTIQRDLSGVTLYGLDTGLLTHFLKANKQKPGHWVTYQLLESKQTKAKQKTLEGGRLDRCSFIPEQKSGRLKVLSVGKLLPPSLCATAVAFHGALSSEVAVSIPSHDTGCRAGDILKLQPRRSWLGAFEILGQISLGPAQLQEEAPCHPSLQLSGSLSPSRC